MGAAGDALRAADVGAIYLAHGTFVGDDALGCWHQFAKLWPTLARGGCLQKRIIDLLVGDLGNFTSRYAREFADGLGAELIDPHRANTASDRCSAMTVRRWMWSSQNNHVGRADGALRFVLELARRPAGDNRRVLVWGHSHSGNVLALVTNLLAADQETRDQFFVALRSYYSTFFRQPSVHGVWQAAQKVLRTDSERLRAIPLDVVTFGTPIRYGWDSDGYARLLHVIHHRPENVRPRREHGLPFRVIDAWRAHEGDYVQRIGIAGSNLPPCWVLRPGARRAERQLHALIQSGVSSRGLLDRLRPALRIADESETVTVDYGPQRGGPWSHLFGHGIYTRRLQMSFHAGLVAERLYDAKGALPRTT